MPNKSAGTESPHLLNDLPTRDKEQHIMVTKILKEYSKILKKKVLKKADKKYAKTLKDLQPGLFKGTT